MLELTVEPTGILAAVAQPLGSASGVSPVVSLPEASLTIVTLTVSNFMFSASDTVDIAVAAVPPGDAQVDGVVNAADITAVERIIALLDPPTTGADASEDGTIDSRDITMIERKIAGLD